jgi:hypothetical protein
MQDEDFEPETKEVSIPRNQLDRLQASLKSPKVSFEKLLTISLWLPKKLVSWWQVLHSNQKIYLLAVILGLSQEESITHETMSDPSIGLLFVGSIAMIGMIRELLDIFTRVWQTLLGKSLIFIIYVIIGNFTLAVAARKVNYITGVDPHSLIYAQGFTTALVLPLWLILLTSMSLILLFTLGNVWFLFLKLVNLLRLHPINVRAKERFSIIFIFIRLMLIPPVMVTLMQPLGWYNNELNIELPGVKISNDRSIEQDNNDELEVIPSGKGLEAKQVITSSDLNEIDDKKQADVVAIIENETDTNKTKVKYTDLDRAIAAFVFEYETFQLSRCEKSDAERVSIIGEDIILVAEKLEEHPLGYKFSARACVLRVYE